MKNNKKLLKIVQAWILVVMALTVMPCSYAAVPPVTQALQDERAVLEGWSVALGNVQSDIEKAIRNADIKARQIHQELGVLNNAIGTPGKAKAVVLGVAVPATGTKAAGLYHEVGEYSDGGAHQAEIARLRREYTAIQDNIAAAGTLIPASVTKLRQVKTVKAYADTCLRELNDLRVAVEGCKALIQGLTTLEQAQAILRPIQERVEDRKFIDVTLNERAGRGSVVEGIDQVKLLPSYVKGADGRGVKKKIVEFEALLAAYQAERVAYQTVVNDVIGGSDAQLNVAAYAGATLVEKARDLKSKIETLHDNARTLRSSQVNALLGAIGYLDPAYTVLQAAQALVADVGQVATQLQEMITFNDDGNHVATGNAHKITGIDLTAEQTERQRLLRAIAAKITEAQGVETQADAQRVEREAQGLDTQAKALAARVGAAHVELARKDAALRAAAGAAEDVPKIREAQAVLAVVQGLIANDGDLATKLGRIDEGAFAAETGYTACTAGTGVKKVFGRLVTRRDGYERTRVELRDRVAAVMAATTKAALLAPNALDVADIVRAKTTAENLKRDIETLQRDVDNLEGTGFRNLGETVVELTQARTELGQAHAIIETDGDSVKNLVAEITRWNSDGGNARYRVDVPQFNETDGVCGLEAGYSVTTRKKKRKRTTNYPGYTALLTAASTVENKTDAAALRTNAQGLLVRAQAKQQELRQALEAQQQRKAVAEGRAAEAQAIADGQREAGAIKARVEPVLDGLQRRLDAVADGVGIDKGAANAALQEVRRLLATGDPARIAAHADVAGVIAAARQAEAKLAEADRAVTAVVEAAAAAAGVAEAERQRLAAERGRLEGLVRDAQLRIAQIKQANRPLIAELQRKLGSITRVDKAAAEAAVDRLATRVQDLKAAEVTVDNVAGFDGDARERELQDLSRAAGQAVADAEAAEAAEQDRLRRERDAAEAGRTSAATTAQRAFRAFRARQAQRAADEAARHQEEIRQARLGAQRHKDDGLRQIGEIELGLTTEIAATDVDAIAARRDIAAARAAINGIDIDTAINNADTAAADVQRIRGQVRALVQRAQAALNQFRDDVRRATEAAEAERQRLAAEGAAPEGGDLGGRRVRRYRRGRK